MHDYIKTIIMSIKVWVESLFVNSTADWKQEDSGQTNYIKNKPEIATDEDAMDLLTELKIISPITTSTGDIYTSNTGEIYTL